jgi:hypothetical protein
MIAETPLVLKNHRAEEKQEEKTLLIMLIVVTAEEEGMAKVTRLIKEESGGKTKITSLMLALSARGSLTNFRGGPSREQIGRGEREEGIEVVR